MIRWELNEAELSSWSAFTDYLDSLGCINNDWVKTPGAIEDHLDQSTPLKISIGWFPAGYCEDFNKILDTCIGVWKSYSRTSTSCELMFKNIDTLHP